MILRLNQILAESGYLGLFKRLSSKLLRERKKLIHHLSDSFFGSYQHHDKYGVLNSILKVDKLELLNQVKPIPKEIIYHYLDHRFDLLGSGWVKIRYGMRCYGLEQYNYNMGVSPQIDAKGKWLYDRINRSNLIHSQKIWQMIAPAYQPIDWQLDFKSGYRWSEKTWSKKIKFGNKLGVDVKVPWELARMQHLPQLALACFSNQYTKKEKDHIQFEFQNQILDFIATNPPGFGVNWVCPMDVAIRAANWLLARDLMLACGINFPPFFEQILFQSIYDHGNYIAKNLEWNPMRANHYLADIAGLAYIAAYLPANAEIDAWLAFAVQELTIEVDRQFYKDGANFEGSTAYHRLSAEMVYYATALIAGLSEDRLEALKNYDHRSFKKRSDKPNLQPGPRSFYAIFGNKKKSPFPPAYWERLELMADFILLIIKSNNRIPQVGDSDSGRFFKLSPIYQTISVAMAKQMFANLSHYDELQDDEKYYLEDHLDCSHLIYAATGIIEKMDYNDFLGGDEKTRNHADTIIIGAYSSSIFLTSKRTVTDFVQIGDDNDFFKHISKLKKLPQAQVRKNQFTFKEENFLEDINSYAAPEFGLYLFKSPRLYLMIRAWTGEQFEPSVHRHEDQLSLELSIDGKDLISDPGTYLYTPCPAERFLYRAASSHFSPLMSDTSKFNSKINVLGSIKLEKIDIIYFGKNGFLAQTNGRLDKKQLAICFFNKSLIIYHVVGSSSTKFIKRQPPYSEGYGIKLKTNHQKI